MDVINRLEEGLLAVDTKGNVTLINKSARQMLGLEKEEVVRQKSTNYCLRIRKLDHLLSIRSIEKYKMKQL